MEPILARIQAAGIRHVAEVTFPRHSLFERNGFAALVPRTGSGFGAAGAAGKLLRTGLGVLVWREGAPYFQTKLESAPACPDEVEELRRFAADLDAALHRR